jgi:acylphosphatase
MTTERVTYSGRVQGVGFRYTVHSIAKQYPITGYVKNLPIGTVELVAQGQSDLIDEFLVAVAERFRHNIVDWQRATIEAGEIFHEFEIRF